MQRSERATVADVLAGLCPRLRVALSERAAANDNGRRVTR